MNGPEHYREAEQLLDVAMAYEKDGAPQTAERRRFEAQVHATLAHVALAAGSQPISGMPDEPGLEQEEFDDWYAAVNGLPEENSKTRLQRAVAELLHDADTSADDQAHEVLARFREGLPDTTHGEPVLTLAEQLMADLEYDDQPTTADVMSATELHEQDLADEITQDLADDVLWGAEQGGDPR